MPTDKKLEVTILIFISAVLAAAVFITLPGRQPIPVYPAGRLQFLAVKDKDYQTCLNEAEKSLLFWPNNEEIWHWKGVCEFELDLFDQARQSFAKVLALDPGHQAANTYSKILNDPKIILVPEAVKKDRSLVESRVDFKFDPGVFVFLETIPGSFSLDRSEFMSAAYSSEKTFEETTNYLKEELTGQGLSFSVLRSESSDYRVVFEVTSRLPGTFYRLFVFSTAPVRVIISASLPK